MNKHLILLLSFLSIFFISCATGYKYTSSFDKEKITYKSGEKIIDYNEINSLAPNDFMAAQYMQTESKEKTNYYIIIYIASKSKLNINSQAAKLYIKTDSEETIELKSKATGSSFENGKFKNYNVVCYYFQIDKKIIEDIFVSDNIFLKLENNSYTVETKFNNGDYVFFTDFFDDNIKKKYKRTKSKILLNLD